MRRRSRHIATLIGAVGGVALAAASASCSARQELSAALKSEPVRGSVQEQDPSHDHAANCLEASEKLRLQNEASIFVGFGESFASDDATNAAAADLVRQIQTKISSSGTTQESNRSVEISNLTQSTVDAMLTGMSVAKRCRDGARWQVVTKLEKAVFFRNIQLRVQPVLREATSLQQTLRSASTPKPDLLAAAARARVLSRGEALAAKDLIAVCRTFNSCAVLNDAELAGLEAAATEVFARFAFSLQPKDQEAVAVSTVVSRLLSEEGFAMATARNSNNAGLSCQRKDFPPMVQTGYMVTEILCNVTFTAGSGDPVTGLTRAYLGNGLGETREEALSEARRKLARKE